MEAYVVEWLSLLVRWLHLIAGIAWIGASFYFIMLDSSLTPPAKPEDVKRGVFGELWAVHGGGLYQSQKYLSGPKGEALSNNLHWSKFEAYTTWLSGMGLLAIIYWYGAATYLIDKSVMAMTPMQAVGISIGVIVGGWLFYSALCTVFDGKENWLLIKERDEFAQSGKDAEITALAPNSVLSGNSANAPTAKTPAKKRGKASSHI